MKEFRATLVPIVLDLMQQYQNDIDPENLQLILQKDAGE